MPFVSQAQRRLFRLKERRGELPQGTVARWEAHTPAGPIPENATAKKAAADLLAGMLPPVPDVLGSPTQAALASAIPKLPDPAATFRTQLTRSFREQARGLAGGFFSRFHRTYAPSRFLPRGA